MRGLCEELERIVDDKFIVDIETVDRNPKQGVEFIGNTKTKIILDKKSDRWTAVSLKDESVIMTLDTRVNMRAEQVIYKQYLTFTPHSEA